MSKVVNLLDSVTQAATGAWVEIPGPGQYAHGRGTAYLEANWASGTTVVAIQQSLDGSTAFPANTLNGAAAAEFSITSDANQLLEIDAHTRYLRAQPDGNGTTTAISVNVVF